MPIPKKASSNKKSDKSNILKNTAMLLIVNKATKLEYDFNFRLFYI